MDTKLTPEKAREELRKLLESDEPRDPKRAIVKGSYDGECHKPLIIKQN
jgi:hypothetical protein